jgi:HK97 family phage major capsid protein
MDLEKQFAEELKANNAAFTEKMTALEEAVTKGATSEDVATIKSEIAANETKGAEIVAKMQEQLDNVSGELKKSQTLVRTQEVSKDPIKVLVKENFEAISKVSKGSAFEMEVKDMTLPVNLTGDQPRDYNFDVVMRPAQMPNVEDLVRTIPISGGTYTYVRSSLAANNIAVQTEGSLKGQNEYSYAMVDASTDFIAGFSVYSRKMRNNLPFLESSLSVDLRRDYYKSENAAFYTTISGAATAATAVTGNKIERLIASIAQLEGANHIANGIVINPADYWSILVTEKSTGAGYGLPGVVTMEGGVMRINGIPIYKATWVAANKYLVGDWSRVTKVVTEGFSFSVSEDDVDNFRKNNITAKVEAQVVCAVEQPSAVIFGDFTAV